MQTHYTKISARSPWPLIDGYYKAANWIRLGDTKGRGKLDVRHENAVPVKAVFVYPLSPDFRDRLAR